MVENVGAVKAQVKQCNGIHQSKNKAEKIAFKNF